MKTIKIILFSILFCVTTNVFAQTNYPYSHKTTDTSCLNKLDLSEDEFNILANALAFEEGNRFDQELDKRIRDSFEKLEKQMNDFKKWHSSKVPTLIEMLNDFYDGAIPYAIQVAMYEILKNR
jgi:hypothetical protein